MAAFVADCDDRDAREARDTSAQAARLQQIQLAGCDATSSHAARTSGRLRDTTARSCAFPNKIAECSLGQSFPTGGPRNGAGHGIFNTAIYYWASHSGGHDAVGQGFGYSIQRDKTSFPYLWLPVSLSAASRVHSLLSACPQSSSIDSLDLSVAVATGTETCPMVCSLTPGELFLVNHRLRCQLSHPLDRPTCKFIHCPCTLCDQFREGPTSWKNAPCLQQSGCKCPHCMSAFNSQGHWDHTKMDCFCAIRGLRGEKTSSQTIFKGIWQTLQRTPVRKWLSLELPRCYVAPTGTVRTWSPQEWCDIKKDTRLGSRDNRTAFLAN